MNPDSMPGSASGITTTVQQILLEVDEWREQAGVVFSRARRIPPPPSRRT